MSTTEQEHQPGTDLVAVQDQSVAAGEPARTGDRPAPAAYADVTSAAGERRRVIPAHLSTMKGARSAARDRLDLQWYLARYHGLRAPAHAFRLLWYSLRGTGRLARRVLLWWHAADLRILESRAVAAGRPGHKDAMAAHQQGLKTRGTRGRILAACLIPAAAAIAVMAAVSPWWGWLLAGLAAVPLLGRHGKPAGQPLFRPALVPQRFAPPTFELVTLALGSAVPAIRTAIKTAPLEFVIDVHPDGPGWSTQLNLPHGVTATMVMNKRAELSAGGRWPLSATWPSGVPHEHEGRLELWIGRQDLSRTKPPPHPLLRTGTADVFGKVPFATTPRGEVVAVPLFEMNWLFGAAPGQGKTSAVRSLLAGAALDPICDLWIHEHSGKGDLEAFRKIAHRYVSGTDDESIAYTTESLVLLEREYQRRIKKFNQLRQAGQAPDFKVTRDMAANKLLRMRPIIMVIDEAQNVFMHPSFQEIAIDKAGYVIRVSRALGIILILSTQRPDAHCIPTAVTGNIIGRFCLYVPGQMENDMVLGTSSRSRGYDSTVFRPKTDAGQGWLKSGEDAPQVVRTFYLNDKDTERLTQRARALREKAGVLSGVALGEDAAAGARSLLADVLSVFGTDEALWGETIAGRLREAIPEAYADITPAAAGSQLRELGVTWKDVREAGKPNRKGCARADVADVAARAGGPADAS